MLELRGLSKRFAAPGGEAVDAVHGVTLQIARGELVALYGPSGSGKTTLLKLIAGLLAPDGGAVILDGRDISVLSEGARARYRRSELGYIDQSFDLLEGASAAQNAALKLWLTRDARRAERMVEPLLVRLGLGERLRNRPGELSMGERQRVMIARALSTDPKLVLADEPTGNLDSSRSHDVLGLLSETCRERGAAVLLVTHDPQAMTFADRVHALRDGRLSDYPDAGPLAARPSALPELLAMRLSSIAHLYRVRLKARVVLVQELLAVLGLAVGVALLFASQVSSASLNDSVARLTRALVPTMQLQLDARGAAGFDERLLGEVQRLPGVRQAAPVLEAPANAVGPSGQRGVELIGIDPRFALRGSTLLQRFHYAQIAHLWALAIPSPLAAATGVAPLEGIELQIAGRHVTALVGSELSGAANGALADSPVVIAPLAYAQSLAGMPGRITRVFIRVLPGSEREVRASLRRLGGGALNVEPADFDARLFAVAAAPINQGAALFAAISALVGFIFAFNAMLLTVPLRQALIRSLRTNGASTAGILAALLFDAIVLAAGATVIGLALGDALSLLVFSATPGYLSFAFPVGSQRIVTWHSIALASSAGVVAALVGVLAPVWGLLERTTRPRLLAPLGARISSLLIGLACLSLTTAILLAAPQSAVLGSVVLLVALLSILPLLLDGLCALFDRVQRHFSSAATRIAVVELRSPRTRVRSLAIAATGATAVFGSVAIQGAQANLQRGVDRVAYDVARAADEWIVPSASEDLLGTAPVSGVSPKELARVPGVRAVGAYRAGFLNFGDRRVWVLAPSPTAAHPFPPSQLVQGQLASTTARLRAGGWAVLSQGLAAQQHLHVGEAFTLPSPRPILLRVAALGTNLSWPPGAVVLNPQDYVRGFRSALPGAYNVMLAPGADPAVVRAGLRRALGRGSALAIESGRQRELRLRATSRQGSSRLTQIATLLLIATVISMSVAMVTMIYQRRPRLARMKVQGYSRGILWRALLVESAVLLGAGCSIGGAFGVFGELLISHALASVTGFPVVFSVSALTPLTASLLVSGTAVAMVAWPGYRAAGVPAYM